MAGARGEAFVVNLRSREMVVPAKPTQRQNYFLSCFDILWKGHHYNQRVIFYESTKGDGAVTETLKSSLAICLVHYYPWCGRLSGGQHRLCIDCNDAGVEFSEAAVDVPISLLSHQAFQTKPFFEQFCPTVDISGDYAYSSPLLSIQATLFSDGGLALGITHSHVVADGQALWSFMVSWGECARGLPLRLPPLLDRQRLAVPNPSPAKATWEFNPKMTEEDLEQAEEDDTKRNEAAHAETVETHSSSQDIIDGAGTVSSLISPPTADRVPCVFTLSSSAIKSLKIEEGGVHTSYEVTCAHLWQRLTVARQRPLFEPTYFIVVANCRSRFKPPLPPAYFGNAISFGIAISTVGKIRNESVNATASRIHVAIGEATQDSLINFMHWLELHDHNLRDELSPKIPKGEGINVVSSPWFPVYEVDFGCGKPTAVRSPTKVPRDGEMVFFGGHPKSTRGDVEICTNLSGDHLRRLLQDPLFLGIPLNNPFHDH